MKHLSVAVLAFISLFAMACVTARPPQPPFASINTPHEQGEKLTETHTTTTTTTTPDGATTEKKKVETVEITDTMAELKLKLAILEAQAATHDPCQASIWSRPAYCNQQRGQAGSRSSGGATLHYSTGSSSRRTSSTNQGSGSGRRNTHYSSRRK